MSIEPIETIGTLSPAYRVSRDVAKQKVNLAAHCWIRQVMTLRVERKSDGTLSEMVDGEKINFSS